MARAKSLTTASFTPLKPAQIRALPARLLTWYDRHRRVLPWRALPGEVPDPYRVWLSEIMLQQTTVAAVGPRFQAFLRRWPTVAALAAAPLDDVLHEWQGLGYYARARNLHRCARVVAGEFGSVFPDTEDGLRELPGIGGYTAGAIASIAFGRKASAVDGNVERVMARLYHIAEPMPVAKPALRAAAGALVPEQRAGDYAQALMDLGATICTPKKPRCLMCPWRDDCRAFAAGDADSLPARAAMKTKPVRHAIAFWVTRPDGAVLLRRRPEDGLLGGMIEVPTTPWRDASWTLDEAVAQAPVDVAWTLMPGDVRHGFTHFDFIVQVAAARTKRAPRPGEIWVKPEDFGSQALPTAVKKMVRHALAQAKR